LREKVIGWVEDEIRNGKPVNKDNGVVLGDIAHFVMGDTVPKLDERTAGQPAGFIVQFFGF